METCVDCKKETSNTVSGCPICEECLGKLRLSLGLS